MTTLSIILVHVGERPRGTERAATCGEKRGAAAGSQDAGRRWRRQRPGVTRRCRSTAKTVTARTACSPTLSLSSTAMSRPSDPQAAALLDHILGQTLRNIEFLASQNYISPIDAAELSSRLTAAQNRNDTDAALASSIQALSVAPVAIPTASPSPPSGPVRRTVPPPPQPRLRQARAVWAYNEDGRVRCPDHCHQPQVSFPCRNPTISRSRRARLSRS